MNITKTNYITAGASKLSEAQKKQIKKEIICLEQHLDRLKRFDGQIEQKTYETYQQMIDARKAMLK